MKAIVCHHYWDRVGGGELVDSYVVKVLQDMGFDVTIVATTGFREEKYREWFGIDFSKPIVEIRKKIELVNSHGLLFVKLIFLSAPVWWSYAIVAIDLFLGTDLYLYLDPDFVLRYLVINFLLIIPLLWVFYKLSYKNLHIKWVRKTIRLFTGTKTMKALEFLNDIEEFKN